jgi:putative DeoR family transcriptional regulator (stage III sporulation protein D)
LFEQLTDIDERVKLTAVYIIETGVTVRAAAKKFGVSKSTVHKDITVRLKSINLSLYEQVNEILQRNKNERHIRGGNATRIKYLEQKKSV